VGVLSGFRSAALECTAPVVPVALRETCMKGVMDGAGRRKRPPEEIVRLLRKAEGCDGKRAGLMLTRLFSGYLSAPLFLRQRNVR